MLAPGGMLSLLVRNGDAAAMRAGLSGDWAGALAAFCTPTASYGLKRLTSTLAGIGAPLHTWYGTAGLHGHGGGRRGAAGRPGRGAGGRGPGRAHGPVPGIAALLHLCGVRG